MFETRLSTYHDNQVLRWLGANEAQKTEISLATLKTLKWGIFELGVGMQLDLLVTRLDHVLDTVRGNASSFPITKPLSTIATSGHTFWIMDSTVRTSIFR